MNDARFAQFLAAHKAEIVHFSTHGWMDHKHSFPDDLNHAFKCAQLETRSCCLVWPSHGTKLPGDVGLMFEPTVDQVLAHGVGDIGALNIEGSERSTGDVLSTASLAKAFEVRDHEYNEWRVHGAIPVGVFVANPNSIQVKKPHRYYDGFECVDDLQLVGISLEAVRKAFPDLGVWTMGEKGIEQL